MAVANITRWTTTTTTTPTTPAFVAMPQYLTCSITEDLTLLTDPATYGVGLRAQRRPWNWDFHLFGTASIEYDRAWIEACAALGRKCRLNLLNHHFENGTTTSPTLRHDYRDMLESLSEPAQAAIQDIEIEAFVLGADTVEGGEKYFNAIQDTVAELPSYADRVSAYLYNPNPNGGLKRRHCSFIDYQDFFDTSHPGLKRMAVGDRMVQIREAVNWIYYEGTDVEPGTRKTNVWLLCGGQEVGTAIPDNWDVHYRPIIAPNLSDNLSQLYRAHHIGVNSISWFSYEIGLFENYFNYAVNYSIERLIDRPKQWDALCLAVDSYMAGKTSEVIPADYFNYLPPYMYSQTGAGIIPDPDGGGGDPGAEPGEEMWSWPVSVDTPEGTPGVPTLTGALLTKTGSEVRIGMYVSGGLLSTGANPYIIFYLINVYNGPTLEWHLEYATSATGAAGSFTRQGRVKDHVECAAIQVLSDNSFIGIIYNGATDKYQTGTAPAGDPTNWTWTDYSGASSYDVCSRIVDGANDRKFHKVTTFVGVDNTRQFYVNLSAISGDDYPTSTYAGIRSDTYALAPWYHGDELVAFHSLFHIETMSSGGAQRGRIVVRLLRSADHGVTWAAPYAATALVELTTGMMLANGTPFRVGSEVWVPIWRSEYLHQSWPGASSVEYPIFAKFPISQITRMLGVIQDDWDQFVSTIPLSGVTGRPKPNNNNYLLRLPGTQQYINPRINDEVVEMDANDQIRAYLPQDAHDNHCMIWLYGLTPDFVSGKYLRMNQKFRSTFTCDFSADSEWDTNIEWCIFWQCWGASYPGTWSVRNPPIALMTTNTGKFRMQVYGESNPDILSLAPHTSWTHETRAEWDFTDGEHEFIIEWISDYRLPTAGGLGYVKVIMDGVTRYESTGIVNAFKSQVDGIDCGGAVSVGVYSGARLASPAYPDITFSQISLEKL